MPGIAVTAKSTVPACACKVGMSICGGRRLKVDATTPASRSAGSTCACVSRSATAPKCDARAPAEVDAAPDAVDGLRVARRGRRDLQRTQCLRQIDRRDTRSSTARRCRLFAQVDLLAPVDLVAVEEPTGEAEPGQSIGNHVVGAQIQ